MQTKDALMEKVAESIETHGWHATWVGASETTMPFAYTTGFTDLGHREVLILALPYRAAHGLLANVYRRIMNGESFSDGQVVEEIADGFPLRFDAIEENEDYPVSLTRRHYGRDVPLLQLVWPDPRGVFPSPGSPLLLG